MLWLLGEVAIRRLAAVSGLGSTAIIVNFRMWYGMVQYRTSSFVLEIRPYGLGAWAWALGGPGLAGAAIARGIDNLGSGVWGDSGRAPVVLLGRG